MELIRQYISFQFLDNRFPVSQTIFQHIQTNINPIVGNRTAHQIEFVFKVNIFAIRQNEILPHFIGIFKALYLQFRMSKQMIKIKQLPPFTPLFLQNEPDHFSAARRAAAYAR